MLTGPPCAGILGSELVENMRKQSERFGTQIFTETVDKVGEDGVRCCGLGTWQYAGQGARQISFLEVCCRWYLDMHSSCLSLYTVMYSNHSRSAAMPLGGRQMQMPQFMRSITCLPDSRSTCPSAPSSCTLRARR
jgi:hypothetical protein